MQKHYVCEACGVEFAPTDEPPPQGCPICLDERQYVNWNGQRWTTLDEMRASGGYRNDFVEEEPGLTSIGTTPRFGIGQRALLVQTPEGNVLWDCLTYLDDATIEAVRARGGLAAIAISHPHFYAANVAWSEAFGNCPVYIHAADREWIMRPSPNVVLWEGESSDTPVPGITLIRLGGHFDGAAVLHWPQGADGRGALLTGDTITVVRDRRYVTFMYSYPNLIPLDEATVRGIADAVQPYAFERIYGGFGGLHVLNDAPGSVQRSADRYIRYLRGDAND